MMTLGRLRERLVAEGMALLLGTPEPLAGGGPEVALVNDITGHPHAFVMGALVDRQVAAHVAWQLPQEVQQRLGSFDIETLATLSESDWLELLRKPTTIHRFPETMATVLHRAVHRIVTVYDRNAANIWSDRPRSATLVRRFLEFHGARPKIATMAANILARNFRVPLRDYRYIDVSADVQVRRVMGRLGFVEEGASAEAVIYAAREANPDFPGVFDLPPLAHRRGPV